MKNKIFILKARKEYKKKKKKKLTKVVAADWPLKKWLFKYV